MIELEGKLIIQKPENQRCQNLIEINKTENI